MNESLSTTPLYCSSFAESDAIIRDRFAELGYLYFPKLLSGEALMSLRSQLLDILADHVVWDNASLKPILQQSGFYEASETFDQLYPRIQALESLHSFFHTDQILLLMRRVLNAQPFVYPMKMARISTPKTMGYETPPHQDAHSHQSGQSMAGIWVALHDIDETMGRLQLLSGSHKQGLRPVKQAQGVGGVQCELYPSDLDWKVNNFSAGDVIIFNSLCVHRAEPNTSLNHTRLSVDTRFCRYGEAVFSSNLYPHHGWRIADLDWHSIYQNWQNDALQFYWSSYPNIHGSTESEWKNFHHTL